LNRHHRLSHPSGEPDSGQLDFSEDRPNSPVAVVGSNPGVPSEGSSLVSAEETVFDGELAERAREAALRLVDGSHGLESGTDLLAEGEFAETLQADSGGLLPPGMSPHEVNQAEGPPEDEASDEAGDGDLEAKRRGKGWKVLKFLQRGRKPASEDSSKSPEKTPTIGVPQPVDSTAPPATGDDDSELKDFFKNFEP
jgi:hypothetical protein